MPLLADEVFQEAKPDFTDGTADAPFDKKPPGQKVKATDYFRVVNPDPETFLGSFAKAAVEPFKALAKSPSMVTMDDDSWYEEIQKESVHRQSVGKSGLGATVGRIAGSVAGGVAEFTSSTLAASETGPAAPFVGPAVAFGASGSWESAINAGVRAYDQGLPKDKVVGIAKKMAGVGAATGAGTAVALGATGLIPRTATALARTGATAAIGAGTGVGSQLIENVAEKDMGLDVSPTEGLLEQAVVMGLLPVVAHAKDLYRQARSVAKSDPAKAKALQQSADDVAGAELDKVATDEPAASPETPAPATAPAKTRQEVAQAATKRRIRQWQEARRAEIKAAKPTIPGTEASQQVGAGQTAIGEIKSNELFTRKEVQDHFRKTGARVPSNEESSALLTQAWGRGEDEASPISTLLSEPSDESESAPAQEKSEISTAPSPQTGTESPASTPKPDLNAVERRIIERHRAEAQSDFDAALAAGNKPEIRKAQNRLMRILRVLQAPPAPAKGPITPKPPLQNVPANKFVPKEVPSTEPEAERGISVIDEIRQNNARTISEIQRLFPQAQLNREAARRLRDQTWGTQQTPEAPPPGTVVENPKPTHPSAPESNVTVPVTDQSSTGSAPNREPVAPTGPVEPKGKEENASSQPEAATVHGDVQSQSSQGAGEVPAEASGPGIQSRADQTPESETPAQPTTDPPTITADGPAGDWSYETLKALSVAQRGKLAGDLRRYTKDARLTDKAGLLELGPKKIAEVVKDLGARKLKEAQEKASKPVEAPAAEKASEDVTTTVTSGEKPKYNVPNPPSDVADDVSRDDVLGAIRAHRETVTNQVDDLKNKPVSEQDQTQTVIDKSTPQTIASSQIATRPDLMQFKRMDDHGTGENAEEKLGGTWDDLKSGLLLLWEPTDPSKHGMEPGQKYIVANGHHRVSFGQREGVGSFNAQVIREADGYSAEDARRIAAEINIADGKGTIYDQVKYLRNSKAARNTDEEVGARARLGTRGGQAATIAFDAKDDLYTAFVNEKVTPEQAEAIAEAAPKNESAQRIGIKFALEGKPPDFLTGIVKRSMQNTGGKATELDLFGSDDSAMRKMEEEENRATQIRKGIREQVQSVTGAAKRPEVAATMGVDVKDPDGVRNRIDELRQELSRWETWWLQPDLVERVRGTSPAPKEVAQPKPSEAPAAPTPKPEPPKPVPAKGGELFSDLPFNLAGEKEMVQPKVETTQFGSQTLAQDELFGIQKVVESKDPAKSADAAQKLYGGAKEAVAKIESQLRVGDSDPQTKRSFVKEQRDRLREVLALLRQRAASGETKEKPAQPESEIPQPKVGMRFFHKRILDPTTMGDSPRPQLFEVSAIRGGAIYYRPIYRYEGGRVEVGKTSEYATPERWSAIFSREATAEESTYGKERPQSEPEKAQGNKPFPKELAARLLSLPSEARSYPYGDSNKKLRQDILEAITGTRPPAAKAGAGAVRDALVRYFGGDPAKLAGVHQESFIESELSKVVGAATAEPAPDQKYRIGNNPSTYSLIERLPQSETEKANGEQPVRVKNDRTGVEETVFEQDLKPVQSRTQEEKASAKESKRDLDAELREAKMDPSVFPDEASKREALRRAKAKAEEPPRKGPGIVGMGGATPADLPKEVSAIRTVMDAAGDGLRKLRSTIAHSWVSGDIRRAFASTRDAGDTAASLFGRKMANEVRQPMLREYGKSYQQRAEDGLTFAAEAKGDINALNVMRDKILNSDKASPSIKRRAVGAIDFAFDQWETLQKHAEKYKAITDYQVQQENAKGIDTLLREGYVMHEQDVEFEPSIMTSRSGTGDATGFRKVREHDTYADSIAAGIDPKSLNAVDLLQARVRRGQQLINKRAWVDGLKTFIDPISHNPIATDPSIITRADGSKYPQAPDGYTLEMIQRQPIAIHKGYEGIISALTDPSAFSRSLGAQSLMKWAGAGKSISLMFDTFHLGRVAFWDSLIKATGVKTFRLPFPSYRKGLTLADYTTEQIRTMAAHGEIPADWVTGLEQEHSRLGHLVKGGYNIGRVSDSLYQDFIHNLPVVGKVNRWVFEHFQRGAMVETGLLEFERLKSARPDMPDADVGRQVARDLNTRFGNLGRQGLLKSRTFQDLARFLVLAPQWNEGLIRSELGAGKQAIQMVADLARGKSLYSGVLLRSVGGMALAQFTANQIINYITRGHPTWENPEEGLGAKLSAWIPDKLGSGSGFFLHPLGLAAETTHLLMRKFEQTGDFHSSLMNYLRSRSSTAMRPMMTFITNQDFLGRNLKPGTVWAQMAADAIPRPIGGQAYALGAKQVATGKESESFAGQFEKQILSSVGIKTEGAPAPASRISSLAREFNRQKGIVPSAEFYSGDYQPLTSAVALGNEDAAKDAMTELLKRKTPEQVRKYMATWTGHPFTGQRGREAQFRATLTPEQKEQYSKAIEQRRKVAQEVFRMLRERQWRTVQTVI